MTNTKFVIPEATYTVIQREDEGAPVYAAVNTSLTSLNKEQRELFSWQLSLILELQTEDDKGLTLPEEAKEIDPFCQQLEADLRKGGNAIPLARITWRKTRELLFRVYNPVQADELIKSIIEAETNPRPFSYGIDPDEEWKLTNIYLKQFSESKS
ncbi:DUF695 domain-containing protein [Alkalimarinus sediminis]|uniref:DUF695 domain-containing protein n=1 Tax=Alkalimarinus sediminis TaxID=1632866 RepID=A0A9E8HID8_9ALTE|nr:DUF695 domain-containing protein [Alkalimarinus sediminis]UZW75238.1 DUF695 domain-containing protein [Alkalimarinus sediminis]